MLAYAHPYIWLFCKFLTIEYSHICLNQNFSPVDLLSVSLQTPDLMDLSWKARVFLPTPAPGIKSIIALRNFSKHIKWIIIF